MTTDHILMRKTGLGLALAILFGMLPIDSSQARDTDIYFTNPNAQQQAIKPNILLILDTSGSMNGLVDDGDGIDSNNISRLQHMKNALNTILDNIQDAKVGLMRFSDNPGGPVLFPVKDIDASTATIEGEGIASVSTILASANDDAEEETTGASAGTVNLNSPDLDMTDGRIVGLRFQNVQIPRGVTVTSAYIRFEVDEADSSATTLTIKGQKTDNAPAFTGATNDVSSRSAGASGTTATVSWAPAAWATVGETETTADIKSIVQEIAGQSSWCSGNSMVLTLEGTGRRVAMSYDGNAAGAPVLVINYDATNVPATNCVVRTLDVRVSGDNDDAEERVSNGSMDRNDDTLDLARESGVDQLVGLRFTNVAVPTGTPIRSAELILTSEAVDSTSPSDPTYKIIGQKTSNAGGFGSTDYNISNRISAANKTAAEVNWTSVPNLAHNETITSPDIGSIITEITSSSNGWASGNSLVLVLKNNGGTGTRLIRSRNDSSSRAPLLRIRYAEQTTLTSASITTVRNRLKQIVNSMEADGSTPIVDALWEAGLYYRGESVLYGKKRGPQSGSEARRTRVSHPGTYSGESGVYRAAGCTDANLNASACETEEILGSATYDSPFENGCQNSYIVLLTDGDPTVNNSVAAIESYIGGTCAGSGNGKCSNELVKYYFDNNLSSLTDKHNIVTHTIGFGDDVTSASAVAYLEGIAANGNGSFKPAANADELVTAFEEILSDVNKNPTSFVSPSLSVNAFNKLFNRDEVYFSLFAPQKQVRWPGNVKKYKLCADTDNLTCNYGEVMDNSNPDPLPAVDPDTNKILSTATSYWTNEGSITTTQDGPTVQKGGAGAEVPEHDAPRKVYTYTGTNADLSHSSNAVNTTNVTKTMLGDAAMSDTRKTEIINWILGVDVKDDFPENADGTKGNGNTTEDRWKFADALHSRPLTVTYGGTADDPVTKIFVGTNDGALRMLNAKSGTEEWIVYIPELLKNQGALMDNASGTHIDGLDGTPAAYIIDNNGNGKIEPGSPQNDKVYLYIGERRGGKDIYAFDVTPANELTSSSATTGITPKFLWRITGGTGDFAQLGQTWSRPLLTKIRVKCTDVGCGAGDSKLKTVLIFAGGYDPRLDAPGSGNVFPTGADTMGNAIYIVDPLTGSRVWWAGGAGSGANKEITYMDYAIPSDVALVDTNGDGATDRLYVGDTRGQVFRVDLGNLIEPGVTGTGGSGGYRFANISNSTKHHNRKFFYAPDIAQVSDSTYSTAKDYDLVVIASGDREDPLDKLTDAISDTQDPVHNRIYAFRDYYYQSGSPATTPGAITESVMYDATANNLGTFTGGTLQTEIDDHVKNSKGWYIKLKESTSPLWRGEKGLAKAIVFQGQILFTTFLPASDAPVSPDSCAPLSEGIGRLYAVDYLTGVAVEDFDNNGTEERFTEVGGGIPSEAVVVIREGGVTALVGTSGGASSPEMGLKQPRYGTYWYQN
jgi:type IV pilus assembly protein PilY1